MAIVLFQRKENQLRKSGEKQDKNPKNIKKKIFTFRALWSFI